MFTTLNEVQAKRGWRNVDLGGVSINELDSVSSLFMKHLTNMCFWMIKKYRNIVVYVEHGVEVLNWVYFPKSA